MRSDQAKHLNHLARAARLAMALNELCEQPILTFRPQTTLALCGQRLRADKRTGFAFQHVEIVIEVEHLLVAFVAAFVAGDAAALIAHFDVTRIEPYSTVLPGGAGAE